ncbi:MAG: hypothetical protein ACFFDT_23705 [Candidatus Hodarchaeota archaeon]
MEKTKISPIARFKESIDLIPREYREVFVQYFKIAKEHNTLNETKWMKIFPTFDSETLADISNPDSPYLFEKNPLTYFIDTHNSLVDFPGALNRILKLIHQRKKIPLSREEFFILLDKVRLESETKNWLTPAFKELIRALTLYPLASTKELAQELGKTPSIIRQRIEQFRNRFILNRVIHLNYYKWGLSRIFLFLIFKNRTEITPALPVTPRYFEKEIPHRLDIFSDLFTIQMYTTPRRQWNAFKRLCEAKFSPDSVEWLGGAPRLFYAEDITLLYNTNTYDSSRRQWVVDEEYLDIVLSTDLWQDLPSFTLSPALSLSYDIDTPRLDFDLLDLKIAYYFYELEGNNNRFSTTWSVAKELNVSHDVVRTRLDRMLKTGMVTFYFLTVFRLPRTVDIILLGEDPIIWKHYYNLLPNFPCSFTQKIRSYPEKYYGIYSTLYLPHGSRVPHLFRDFCVRNKDILTGFSAESQYVIIPKRPLWQYWDPVRNRWRWDISPKEIKDIMNNETS